MSQRHFHIGIDTGGTFTDLVVLESDDTKGKISSRSHIKIPSTPHDPAQAIAAGLQQIAVPDILPGALVLLHGSTVATNAILERRGARTALITTRGFGDLLFIGRQDRPNLYQFDSERPHPLLSREDVFEVSERILANGDVGLALNETEVQNLAAQIHANGYQAIGICFLHSYANPQHEERTRNILKKSLEQLRSENGSEPTLSISSEINPQFREFERLSTTTMNAFVQPIMSQYLSHLEDSVATGSKGRGRLKIMRSDGGQFSPEHASVQPLQTVFSGPAGGVNGAYHLAQNSGLKNIITFDMGGTSTDVSLVPDEILCTQAATLSGLPIRIPTIDIHSVGAGGGSIARLDEGRTLRVGPESAGADPGPICYGRGNHLTITDTHLFLGRLDSQRFLGGKMILKRDPVQTHMQQLAKQLKTSPFEVAELILELTESTMERAIRVISVDRGFDPRDFTLVCFGGAGGLHAASLAQKLWIPQVLVPPDPGVLSAFGMLFADTKQSESQTVLLPSASQTWDRLREQSLALVERCRSHIEDEGFTPDQIDHQVFLEMRYIGQSYELAVPLSKDFNDLFHQIHRIRYGRCEETFPTEIVHIRCDAVGREQKPRLPQNDAVEHQRPQPLQVGRCVYRGEKWDLPYFLRTDLSPGVSWEGPALIIEYSATTFVPPGCYGRVDPWGNIIMDIPSGERAGEL